MRRLAALLLLPVSIWLIFQSNASFIATGDFSTDRLIAQGGDVDVMLPTVGGVLGFVGGLVILFGGVGGAALGMIGGVIVAGYAIYQGAPLWTGEWQVWNNPELVGLAILALAGFAAVMGRD
ncbi:MAG TPA: hypothetical protein VG942_07345 [Hyphomonadaceae bacterium]|nr:hypothetical protein [Hyphomonadaceae bacterium]